MMRDVGDPSEGVLTDVRVLDLSTVLAAPVAATFLGDFGAEVIKVELPRRGDFTRGGASTPGGRTPMWAQEGRNKRSVCLDLHTSAGQEIARRLAACCDVVVTNFRPSTMERWELGPGDLRSENNDLVVLAVTGYGLTGPYCDRGSFDRIASAYSGHTYVSAEPGRAPVRAGFAVIDYMSAYLGAFAVLLALRHRDRGGGGQVIDLALFEAGFRATESSYVSYAVTGSVRQPSGNRNPLVVPATESKTVDGRFVAYHAGTDPLFERLAGAVGRPEWVEDPRFCDVPSRERNQEALYVLLDAWVGAREAAAVVEVLSRADVPVSLVMNVSDVAEDPHYRARGTFEWHEDPDFGPLPMTVPLPRFSATPGRIRSLGEPLGASTESVLRELLGMEGEELAGLRGADVI